MLIRWPVITQVAGAAIALAAGLSLGGYMKPQLVTDHPLGPQMLTPASAQRSGDPVDDGATLARYGAKLPDYVLGTDMTRPMSAETAPVMAPEPAPQEDPPAPLEIDRTDYHTPTTVSGGIADGSDTPTSYSDQTQQSPAAG